MNSSNINIRVDSKTKDDAEKIFRQLGLTLSSAIIVFLNQSINQNGIPFPLTLDKMQISSDKTTTEDAVKEK